MAFAQNPVNSQAQHYQKQIDECSRVVGNWQLQAHLQIAFVLIVILCGALITIFQGVSKGWCKPATLFLGACTTILTSVNAKVFTADYRVLQQSVIEGDDLIDQLNTIVENLSSPQADAAGLQAQWIKT
jgi:hypothetical protein